MTLLQLVCAAIVATYVALRLRRAPHPGAVALRLALLAVASFVGEDTVIRAYGFYGYARGWWLFLDRVPLLVVLIWPVVVDSAWVLAEALVDPGPKGPEPRAGGRGAAVTTVFLLVLADAALIEPVAVRAGLWSWTRPGPFHVPLVGVMGWAFFAASAVALAGSDSEGRPSESPRLRMLLAAIPAHGLLVASWWLLFRHVTVPVSPWLPVAVVWPLALGAALALNRRPRTRGPVPPAVLARRAPGALFFFGLLLAKATGDSADVALVAYALAFAVPYGVLLMAPLPSPGVAKASSTPSGVRN